MLIKGQGTGEGIERILQDPKFTGKQKAIEIWNYTIVIDRACNAAGATDNRLYRLAMAGTVKQNLSFRISETDYYKLLERKEALYPNNNFFIIEHNVRWSDNDSQLHLAVVTSDADKVKL